MNNLKLTESADGLKITQTLPDGKNLESHYTFLRDLQKTQGGMPSNLELKTTDMDYRQFIVKSGSSDHDLTAADISRHISAGNEGPIGQMASLQIKHFNDQALILSKKVPLKPFSDQKYVDGCADINVEGIAQLKKNALNFNNIEVQAHPKFEEGVGSLVNSLDLLSNNVLEVLDLLLRFAQTSELLTFLASSPMLLKCLGVNLYVLMFSSFCIDGSFRFFLTQVRKLALSLISPFYHTVEVSLSYLYKNKFIFAGAGSSITAAIFFGYNYLSSKTIVPVINAIIDIPKFSQWAIRSPFGSMCFEGAKRVICVPAYMASNLSASIFAALRDGSFDAFFGAKNRVVLEDALNKVAEKAVPIILDAMDKKKK